MPCGVRSAGAKENGFYSKIMNTLYFVYMVRCVDGTLYTGITTDVARRVDEHNGVDSSPKSARQHTADNGAKYTRARRPVRLVYRAPFDNRSDAMREEWRIKKLKRTQKEALLIAYKKSA